MYLCIYEIFLTNYKYTIHLHILEVGLGLKASV